MSFTYNTILTSDLRDSGGHTLKIVEFTGVEGTYRAGGVILLPQDFGFEQILSFSSQPMTIAPLDLEQPNEPWVPYAEMCPMRTDLNLDGNFEWRMIILLHPAGYGGEEGDGIIELPDDSPMQFYPQLRPTATIIGA